METRDKISDLLLCIDGLWFVSDDKVLLSKAVENTLLSSNMIVERDLPSYRLRGWCEKHPAHLWGVAEGQPFGVDRAMHL